MKSRLLRATFALVVVAACTAETLPPKGQLMLVVTTNLAPPKDFDSFHLRIVEDGNDVPIHDIEYAMTGSQAAKLPATLGIVAGGDPNRIVRISVEALRGGTVRVKREAIARVPQSRIASLPLPIDGLCIDSACPPDATGKAQTCIAGSCQTAEVDVDALPDFSREAAFGGGTGDGDGTCFDTLECFAQGHVAEKTADCAVVKESGPGFNVAVLQPTKSDGICAANACLIPLDPDPFTGPIITGWREEGGRVKLPIAICDRKLPVMVTTTCPTKNAPTCGAWSSVGKSSGADASLPIDGAPLGDAALPSNVPAAIAFLDADPRERFVTGTVKVTRAPDESGLTGYAIYWADGPSKKLDLLTTLPKTGSDVTHVLDGPMLPGATHLIAAATTASGEIMPFVQTGPIDNFARQTNITVNAAEMLEPNLLVDQKNQKLLILGFDEKAGRMKPALIRCALDGTGCTYVDVSAGLASGSNSWTIGGVIDETNDKLVFMSDHTGGNANAQYFQCALDGTSCTTKMLGSGIGQIQTSGRFPVLIDAANKKLVAVNPSSTGTIYRCDLDGTNCGQTSFQPGGLGSPPETALISPTDAKLLIVRSSGGPTPNVPTLFRCELDGNGCGVKDISAGDPSTPIALAATIDPINQKLLVVGHNTNDPQIRYWRCNLDGTACTTDLLADLLTEYPSPEYADIVVDVPHAKVFVFASVQAAVKTFFYRCDLDLTGCTATTIITSTQGRYVRAVLANGIFYVVQGRYGPGNDFATFAAY